jgi:Cu-processing system permease protein
MRRVSSIAFNTFRESVREKLLYIGFLFGGILIVSTFILSPLAIGARGKIIMDVGLASISLLGVLTAILVGGTLVHKEVDKRAVHIVLTRPVSRWQYLVGKFTGVVLAVAALVGVMSVFFLLTLLLGSGTLGPVVFAALYLSLLEIIVMCAVVIFFSTFTTPILTSFFSLCIFAAGSLSNDLRVFAQKFGGASLRYAVAVFYYLLPNLKVFNLRHEAVHGLPFRGSDVALVTIYALVYCSVALYFAHLAFRRREFV